MPRRPAVALASAAVLLAGLGLYWTTTRRAADPPADAPAVVPETPGAVALDPPPPAPAPPAAPAPETMTMTARMGPALRPAAPLRVEGACPFECCQYGTWTTTAPTRLFAAAHDTTRVAATVPAGTALTVRTGHVWLTRLGRVVVREPVMLFRDFEDGLSAAAGDTLVVLQSVGEGAFRVWYRGEVLEADHSVLAPGGRSAFPQSQWWARATAPDGTRGWLWMERTPPVRGADACAGP